MGLSLGVCESFLGIAQGTFTASENGSKWILEAPWTSLLGHERRRSS